MAMGILAPNPTLNVWAEHWLDLYIKPVAKPSGYEHYHDNMHKHILPKLGHLTLSEITTPVVQAFFNEEADHGNLRNSGPLSAKSMRNMRVVLDVCCKRAVADGYMPANPVPATVLRRGRTTRIDVMTDDTQSVLEEYLFAHDTSRDAGVSMALFSGMRLGEVCALQWRDYNFRTQMAHIRNTVRRVTNFERTDENSPKTRLIFTSAKTEGSDRELYFSGFLHQIMCRQYHRFCAQFGREPGGEEYVIFNQWGGHMDPDSLSQYFRKLQKKLNLPHIKYHALRHTFATRAVESGIDVATVSGLLGHGDVTTTTHYYVHPRQDAMRKAMEKLGPISGYRQSSCF